MYTVDRRGLDNAKRLELPLYKLPTSFSYSNTWSFSPRKKSFQSLITLLSTCIYGTTVYSRIFVKEPSLQERNNLSTSVSPKCTCTCTNCTCTCTNCTCDSANTCTFQLPKGNLFTRAPSVIHSEISLYVHVHLHVHILVNVHVYTCTFTLLLWLIVFNHSGLNDERDQSSDRPLIILKVFFVSGVTGNSKDGGLDGAEIIDMTLEEYQLLYLSLIDNHHILPSSLRLSNNRKVNGYYSWTSNKGPPLRKGQPLYKGHFHISKRIHVLLY